MEITCTSCGQSYRADLQKITSSSLRFKCQSCGDMITVRKEGMENKSNRITSRRKAVPPPKAVSKKGGLGLKGKLLLFLMVPLIMALLAQGFYSMRQMEGLSDHVTRESAGMVSQMAEKQVVDHARAVALQLRLYLRGRGDLQKEAFDQDLALKRIAVQKVGLTGYSFLYELPQGDGVWRAWAHPVREWVGRDLQNLRSEMGADFDDFWKILTGVKVVEESLGYFSGPSVDGTVRRSFMACAPVQGTQLILANVISMDEFSLPIKRLERSSRAIATQSRVYYALGLVGTILLVGLIAFLYGRKVTGDIRAISHIADRISLGELDADVGIRSKDEIGELAESITRMQDSLKLSLERLRHRRAA